MIDSATQLCISLSARPGSFGNRFHNYLYGELRLNYVYRAGTTTDLPTAVAGLRALKIRGCGLSMPYKEQATSLVDDLDPDAREIGAINTIVNEDVAGAGRLRGFNTDYLAVLGQLQNRRLPPGATALLAGSGGMARACAHALSQLKIQTTVCARNQATGQALAKRYGFAYVEKPKGEAYTILLNATPVGMTPDTASSPFALEQVKQAQLILESVANPAHTAFVKQARELGIPVIEGFDIQVAQGAEQFKLYTGVSLRVDQIGRAAVYARAPS